MRTGRIVLLLLAAAVVPGGGLLAQPAALGVKFTAVPDALYAHLPTLERGQGLLVEAIQPGSRAAAIGLKPFDVVVAVGTSPVKDGAALEGKLAALAPGEREVLQIIRGGKPFALTVATAAPAQVADPAYAPPKSLFKPGGPPAVSVEVKSRAAGGMEVNLFYLNQANKMERRALHGSLDDIERQVADLAQHGQMTEGIRDLVAVALQRLRTRNAK